MWLTNKIATIMMSEQLAEGKMGSNWPPYEVKKRFLRDLGDVSINPICHTQSDPGVISRSSDKAFWEPKTNQNQTKRENKNRAQKSSAKYSKNVQILIKIASKSSQMIQ